MLSGVHCSGNETILALQAVPCTVVNAAWLGCQTKSVGLSGLQCETLFECMLVNACKGTEG